MNDKYVGIIFFVAFMHARIIIQLNNITGPSVDGRYGHRGNKANHIFFLFVFLHFLTVCTEQWLFLLFAFFVRLLCRRIKSCVSVALFFGHCECAFGLIHGFACFNHSNVLSRVGDCVDRRSAAGYSQTNCFNFFFPFKIAGADLLLLFAAVWAYACMWPTTNTQMWRNSVIFENCMAQLWNTNRSQSMSFDGFIFRQKI